MSSPIKVVFSRATCPAFNNTSNGETGILQTVRRFLLHYSDAVEIVHYFKKRKQNFAFAGLFRNLL